MYFAKRATSKFCSSNCRVKYNRGIEEPKIGQVSKPKEMTQTEKEEYYTLKNFPAVHYTSSANGGTLRRSPYPRSDKKSLAYLDS